MNRSLKIFAAAALVAAAACVSFTSCKSKTKTPPAPPTFERLTESRNMATTAGNFELSYDFEYIAGYSDAAVLEKIRSAMIADFFGSEFVRGSDVAASAAVFKDSMAVRHGIAPVAATAPAAATAATAPVAATAPATAAATAAAAAAAPVAAQFKWDGHMKIRSKASIVGNRIVTYAIDRSEYTGGAHGMETQDNVNYDLTTGNRLALDNMFTPEGKAALAATIRAQILKDKGVATWEELMTRDCYSAAAEVLPSENFSLTATEITFVYNPYDIACFAAGSTRVTLPLANLAGFKKDEY